MIQGSCVKDSFWFCMFVCILINLGLWQNCIYIITNKSLLVDVFAEPQREEVRWLMIDLYDFLIYSLFSKCIVVMGSLLITCVHQFVLFGLTDFGVWSYRLIPVCRSISLSFCPSVSPFVLWWFLAFSPKWLLRIFPIFASV